MLIVQDALSYDPPAFRFPHVGGGGSVVLRSTGFALSKRMASSTARELRIETRDDV
jgi:hypothetical protein